MNKEKAALAAFLAASNICAIDGVAGSEGSVITYTKYGQKSTVDMKHDWDARDLFEHIVGGEYLMDLESCIEDCSDGGHIFEEVDAWVETIKEDGVAKTLKSFPAFIPVISAIAWV